MEDADERSFCAGNTADASVNGSLNSNPMSITCDYWAEGVDEPTITQLKYTESLQFCKSTAVSTTEYLTHALCSGDTEMVIYFNPSMDETQRTYAGKTSYSDGYCLGEIISLTSFKYSYVRMKHTSTSDSRSAGITDTKSFSIKRTINGKEYSFHSYEFVNISNSSTDESNYNTLSVSTGRMKVFNDYEAALKYLSTGVLNGLAWEGNEPASYDSDRVYFDKIDIIYHDSNSFDNCYVEFLYKLPEHLRDSKNLKLRVFSEYDMQGKSDDYRLDNKLEPFNSSGINIIDLSENLFSYRLFLKDIPSITDYLSKYGVLNDSSTRKKQVIGREISKAIRLDGSIFDCIYKINLSKLYLYCTIMDGNCYGDKHCTSIDLINGSTDYHSQHVDSSGNYTSNNDNKIVGHYYTDVSTDPAGNTTYNYYYYGDDNSVKNITKEENDNNSAGNSSSSANANSTINNSPVFNNNNNVNVTVEGDSINNEIENVVTGNENTTESGNKGFIARFLAFFELLKNNTFMSIMGDMFGWLPGEVFLCLAYAIGLVGGIAVFKFFRK